MAISVDWQAKRVISTASITDVVAFKDAIRDLEDDATGMLYDSIITYKRVDLGGGAYFHAVDFINGYELYFPNAGNYTIIGNINAAIVPVAGVFVDRTKAAAFATVAGSGGGGSTPEQIWEHVIENGLSAEEMLRVFMSVLAGKVSGAGTNTEIFRDLADTKNRVTVTADDFGNRSNVVIDGS
jgi:hypothetical protein